MKSNLDLLSKYESANIITHKIRTNPDWRTWTYGPWVPRLCILVRPYIYHTVWKSTIKSDHCNFFFPSNRFTKIHEFRLSQMDVFTPLGGISKSNQWNAFWRERFDVKFIHNEVFKSFNLNICKYFITKHWLFSKPYNIK